MTTADALAAVLTRLSDGQIHALERAVASVPSPPAFLTQAIPGAPPAAVEAVAALRRAWAADPAITGAGLALALRTGLVHRQERDRCAARPVWTGPGAVGEERLTAGVLHELLAGAQRRILLVSFAAYTLPELAEDLAAAVERGVTVDVVFETAEDSDGAYHGPAQPFAAIPGISRWRWPQDHRDAGAVLHAKLVVVDGRRALVGSANLTHRALTANLEVGVLLHENAAVAAMESHVRRLIMTEVLVPAG